MRDIQPRKKMIGNSTTQHDSSAWSKKTNNSLPKQRTDEFLLYQGQSNSVNTGAGAE